MLRELGGATLNILPGIAGIFVARHLKISRSAAVELSWLAFWNGLSLRREVSDQAEKAGTTAENYRRPRRSRWAVVPADQYSFTKFL